uniref:Protein kinase domain-containing protein n=1 Tax=Caenorhabditis tropicalis TaxID=1561998 RepID=A0A1I7TS95_9PELO
MAKLRDQGVKFDVLDAKIYTFQLFSAIGHLAMNNIVHMDIKPQNVIMDRVTGLLKLADFGNARRLDTDEKTGGAYQVQMKKERRD